MDTIKECEEAYTGKDLRCIHARVCCPIVRSYICYKMRPEEVSQDFVNPFTFEDVEAGLKKWLMGRLLIAYMCGTSQMDRGIAWEHGSHILTHALEHGFPNDWQENSVQLLYKGGDCNLVTNLRTIMGSSTLAKLLYTVLETKISTWVEEESKQAIEQASFQQRTLYCRPFGHTAGSHG